MNFSEAPDKNNWISGLAANHLGYILFALPIVALFFISKEFDYTKWPQPIRWFVKPLIRVFILGDSSSSTDTNDEQSIPLPAQTITLPSSFAYNRYFKLSATIVAYTSLKIFYPLEKLTSTGPPVSYYAIIAYANCMSTWFQYESLLYVSFPIQVVAKSIKTIPVMIVGKLVS
ncbi:unnamed protein product, partial [Adineta steineri]